MPIYEYICHDCKTKFEMIRSIQDADSPPHCINCDGTHIDRQISIFHTGGGARINTSSSGCSSCRGGSCTTCGSNS